MRMAEALAELDRAFRALIIEWDRYFSGDRRLPPVGDRDRFARRLRVLTGREARGAEAFRREQLQHRFSSYVQMWERLLRRKEEGREAGGYIKPRVGSEPNASAAPAVEPRGKGDLYDVYVAEKAQLGQEVGVSRRAFLEQLDRQREELEKRFGRKIGFRIQIEDGRVKVAVRAARRPQGGE